MMSNRMMLNVNRNMARLNILGNQMATGKRISFPSDDPILAARVLKFRTSLRETEQWQRNVNQGISWMESTDAAFVGVREGIAGLRLEFQRAISAENRLPERQAIINVINEMKAQLGSSMNTSYAGRYVFSGFRTNHPPIFETNQPDLSFALTQTFRFSDIENTTVVQRINDRVTPKLGVNMLKLAYAGNIENLQITISGTPGWNGTITTFDDPSDHISNEDAYNPGPDDIHFIRETGQLILGSNVVEALRNGTMTASYVRNGFSEGELNPMIYFNSFDITNSPVMGNNVTDVAAALYAAFPTGHPIRTTDQWTALENAFGAWAADPTDEGLRTDFQNEFLSFLKTPTFTVGGTADPDISISLTEQRAMGINHFNNRPGDLTDQRLEFEFSFNTRIPINTLARDVLTDKLHADLRELIRFINGLEEMLSDPLALANDIRAQIASGALGPMTEEQIQQKVSDQIAAEHSAIDLAMQNRFNSMLGRIDVHNQGISRQDADLGSRMQRLDMIRQRLVYDRLNFRELISENEDIEYHEAAAFWAMARVAHEASLSTGARILQLTLADFIR